MNWSAYSRYVGDVFGGPLAMEGLAAFFLESTFLGLWVFGWDRLSRRVHLFCIWMVALGVVALGGVHHGRELVDAAPGRLRARRRRRAAAAERHRRAVHEPGVHLGLLPRAAGRAGHGHAGAARGLRLASAARRSTSTRSARARRWRSACSCRSSIALVLVGSQLGVIETRYQPMKIAAAEAQWETCQPCSFSAFQIGGGNERRGPAEGDRDPAPALDPGHAEVGRGGRRAQRAAGAVRAAVRAGRLRPERVRAVLVDAGDGLPGDGDRAAVAVGRVAAAPAPAGDARSGSCASAIWACSRRS